MVNKFLKSASASLILRAYVLRPPMKHLTNDLHASQTRNWIQKL